MVLKQFRLVTKDNRPVAFATWALVSEEVELRMKAGETKLKPGEWKSGDRCWIVDLVAPYGGAASSLIFDESVTPQGNYVPWVGPVVLPWFGLDVFTRDWLFTLNRVEGTLPDGTSTIFKDIPGTYDFVAALQAGIDGSLAAAGMGIGNLFRAFVNTVIGPSEALDVDQADLVQEGNSFFLNAYGLDPSTGFRPADSLLPVLTPDEVFGPKFTVGTYFDDPSITPDPSGVDNIVHAGFGNDTIIGFPAGSNLIDIGESKTGVTDADTDTVDYSGSFFTLTIALEDVTTQDPIVFSSKVFLGMLEPPPNGDIDHLYNVERILATSEGDRILVKEFSDASLQQIEFIDLADGPSSGEFGDTIDLTPITEDIVVDLSDPMAQTARLKGGAATLNVRGAEVVRSGDGNDTIVGGPAAEFFFGGGGNDRFIAGPDDTIMDPQNADRVVLNGQVLGEVVEGEVEEDKYIGDQGEEYRETAGGLSIVLAGGAGTITIEGWRNDEAFDRKAGITLVPDEDEPVDASIFGSPLVLDLDGDGLELIDLDASGAFFDIDRDGFAERMGWVAPDDGFLALDRDLDGAIGDVGELFGAGFVAPSVSLENRLPSDASGFATLAEPGSNYRAVKTHVCTPQEADRLEGCDELISRAETGSLPNEYHGKTCPQNARCFVVRNRTHCRLGDRRWLCRRADRNGQGRQSAIRGALELLSLCVRTGPQRNAAQVLRRCARRDPGAANRILGAAHNY